MGGARGLQHGRCQRPPEGGQFLCPLDVTQMQECIVDLDELDVVVIEPSCQPLVAVDVHLNPKREPGLQLDVNETQVARPPPVKAHPEPVTRVLPLARATSSLARTSPTNVAPAAGSIHARSPEAHCRFTNRNSMDNGRRCCRAEWYSLPQIPSTE